MPSDEPSDPNLTSLRTARERATARLSDAFADDVLDVDGLQRRLTLAHRANSMEQAEQTPGDLRPSAPRQLPAKTGR